MRKKEKEKIKTGEELYQELQNLIYTFNKEDYGYGRASIEVENWIAGLSLDEFNNLLSQPIGNIARTHYSAIRQRRLKEKQDVVLVYLGKETKETIDTFHKYLEENGFKRKTMPPYNNPSCPWTYVLLYKKEYVIGKAGIDMFPRRYIYHSVKIDEFKIIHNVYKSIGTLDNPDLNRMVSKYKHYSLFCFDLKAEIKHKIHMRKLDMILLKNKIKEKLKSSQ